MTNSCVYQDIGKIVSLVLIHYICTLKFIPQMTKIHTAIETIINHNHAVDKAINQCKIRNNLKWFKDRLVTTCGNSHTNNYLISSD